MTGVAGGSGLTVFLRAAALISASSALLACAGAPAGGPGSAEAPRTPQTIYGIEAVAPDFDPSAVVAGFAGEPGEPRAIGAFVGRAVIDGVDGVFSGAAPVRLTTVIHRFEPATLSDRVHRVALDFVLTPIGAGDEIGRSGVTRIELPAAPDAGAPADALSTRIARSAAAWAADVACGDYACPVAAAVVETAEPAPDDGAEGGGGFFSSIFGGGADEEAAASGPPAPSGAGGLVAPVPTPRPGSAPVPVPVPPGAAPAPVPAAQEVATSSQAARQPVPVGRAPLVAAPRFGGGGRTVLDISGLPAFWDGAETTGGVWIALPYTPVYRRARLTNPATGEVVDAVLLWRDPAGADDPGPGGGRPDQPLISSAAAAALGVAPGGSAPLRVEILAGE